MLASITAQSPVVIGCAVAAVVGAGVVLKKVSAHNKLAQAEKNVHEHEEKMVKQVLAHLLAAPYYADLENLRKQLEGEVIIPSDGKRYHDCRRRAFNQNQRGFPCVVVRVTSVKDVATCVRFAAKHKAHVGLCIASGCHSSKCMMDYSFVIDMMKLNKAQLNLEAQTVSVEGGAYLEEIDKVLAPHNLGVTVGTYPETGVGGLVLGGGFGFLGRMYGFSVDNFIEAEVVLPTGDVVVANDKQNADLMWALRGGGGNFGVVTKFTFKVHKLPKYCIAGGTVKVTPTISSAIQLACNYDKLLTEFPDNYMGVMVLAGGAPVTPLMWACFEDTNKTAELPFIQKINKLEGGWLTLQNDVKERSYHFGLQRITTAVVTSGHIYHTLIQFGTVEKPIPEELWRELLTFVKAKLPAALDRVTMLVFPMGGQMSRLDPQGSSTCLTHAIRKSKFFGVLEIYWRPEFGDEGKSVAREYCKTIANILKPYCSEALRYASADDSIATADLLERDNQGYTEEAYEKLRVIKSKYDPTNMFRNNMNIQPADIPA